MKNKLFYKIKEYFDNPATIAIFLYILSIIFISPWSNFPLGDDFYYVTQVKAFSMGVFTKSALIGPTLILQTFIGLLWGSLFGISYISLRVLTILLSMLCIFVFENILKYLNIRKSIRVVSLILFVFLPQFYAHTITFMTEIYFLLFILFSIYYFLRSIKSNSTKDLVIASVMGGLSIMIRQYGVVLFITYLFVYLLTLFSNKKERYCIKKILYLVIPFIIFGCLGVFWPKYQSLSEPKSMDISLFFTDLRVILIRISNIKLLPYIGYLVLPFTIPAFIKRNTRIKLIILTISLFLFYFIFRINIFSYGNLFYLEGINARLQPNVREHLFNNVPFKIFISYLITISLVTFFYFLIKEVRKYLIKYRKKDLISMIPDLENSINLFLFILLIGFYLIVMITDRVFDRYLLNFFIILIIILSLYAEKADFTPGRLSILICVFLSVITFFLQYDYYKLNELRWKLAYKLSEEIGINKYDIFVDNVYAQAIFMEKTNNFRGFITVRPQEYRPICFVQEYVKQKDNLINTALNYINDIGIVKRYIANPKIEDGNLLKEMTNHFDKTDILFFNEQYPSPIYSLVGKKTFIRAFCLRDYPSVLKSYRK